MEKQSRSPYLDVLKGFAIILVIVGHSIQYGSGDDYWHDGLYYDNALFKFIYSFHMPLFMLVSGYLFYFSTQHYDFKDLIRKKFMSVFVPLISWHTLFLIILILYGGPKAPSNVHAFAYSYLSTPWFLRAILWCFAVVIAIKTLLRDKMLAYIILFLILPFIPNRILPNVHVFMIYNFVIGYLFNKYGCQKQVVNSINGKWGLGSFLIIGFAFIIMLRFYRSDYYVYISGTYLFNKNYVPQEMAYIDSYRLIIGLLGASLAMILIYWIIKAVGSKYRWPILAKIGQCTLPIYLFNYYFIDFYEYHATILPRLHLAGVNYIVIVIESIGMLVIAMAITLLLQKSRILRLLFLGGR